MLNSNLNNFVYVDTLDAYKYFCNKNKNIDVRFITDNPLLANTPNLNYDIYDLSELVEQQNASQLGKMVLKLCNEMEQYIIDNDFIKKFKYLSEKLGLFMVMRALILSTLYKSLIMSQFLKKTSVKSINFVINKSNDTDINNPWNIPRYANTYKILADLGFFQDITVTYSFIDIKTPTNFNDTKDKNFLLRASVWPFSVILYRFFSFTNKFFSNKRKIYVLKECETLKESIPWLQLKGYKIEKINLNFKNANNKFSQFNENILDKGISNIISNLLRLKGFTKNELNAQKTLFLKHLNLGLKNLSVNIKSVDNLFKDIIPNGSVILTSGFYGPDAYQIFYLAKKYNIRIIGFEHGMTAGVNYSNSLYKNYLESTTCNLLLVCSSKAKSIFYKGNNSHKFSKKNNILVIGEADQKKYIKNVYLQKSIVKNRYNIKHNEDIVIHVSGLSYGGNYKNAIDGPLDNYLFKREKILLENVYNKINKKVIYKDYPSQRMLYQPKYSDIRCIDNNIIMAEKSDFRYIRLAADVVVTDSTYSTLSWCVMPNVPLIFLKSSICSKLIDNELENLIDESFIVIDTDLNDWNEKLKKILNFSKDKLLLIWKEKEDKREYLNESYLFGPKGSTGVRAANYISKIISDFDHA